MARAETQKAFITGASRGIGAETAVALAARGWDVALGVREKQKKVDEVAARVSDLGRSALIVKGDITDTDERRAMIAEVGEWSGELDSLVLNAAGGLEPNAPPNYARTINVDSQISLVEGFRRQMKPDSSIVYINSHWGHKYGEVELPPFDYEPIASTKNQFEKTFDRMRIELSSDRIRQIVVTAGLVTGTVVGNIGARRFAEFTEEQRAIGNVVEVAEVGDRIAAVIADPTIPSGHVEVIGAPLDVFLKQSGVKGE